MNFVSGYGQPSDAATYNIRFDSDDHKKAPIRLFPFFALITTGFLIWVLTLWLQANAAFPLAIAIIVMGLAAYVLAKHSSPPSSGEYTAPDHEEPAMTMAATRSTAHSTNDSTTLSTALSTTDHSMKRESPHSEHINKAITHIGASLIAEANARLPESRFVVPSLESLLFLIEEQQHFHLKSRRHLAPQTFSPRDMVDRIAGLVCYSHPISILPCFDPDVPEQVIAPERAIMSALYNVILDEMSAADTHPETISMDISVLKPAEDTSTSDWILCITFRRRTGKRVGTQKARRQISHRTQASADAAGVWLEQSLIRIPVVATATMAPVLAGNALVMTENAEEEQSLTRRLERWGLNVVREQRDAQVILLAYSDQHRIEHFLKDVDQSAVILLNCPDLITNVTVIPQPLLDSELYRACAQVLKRHSSQAGLSPSKEQSPRSVSPERLPMFDPTLALARANHRPDLAEEFLDVFMDTIDDDQTGIHRAYERGDLELLKRRIHKLNGATRFCGLPRLNRILARLGKLAESGTREELDLAMTLFTHEVHELQTWYDPHRNLFGTSLTRTELP
ncbi:MAG: Hpt domain-containing protein [Pseudomonadota bacterium]